METTLQCAASEGTRLLRQRPRSPTLADVLGVSEVTVIPSDRSWRKWDMTESEAFELAVQYAGREGIAPVGCNYKGCLYDSEVYRGLLGDGFPKGCRRKVWYFQFALEEVPPNTVVSGGEFVVYVDDDSGICGYMGSL